MAEATNKISSQEDRLAALALAPTTIANSRASLVVLEASRSVRQPTTTTTIRLAALAALWVVVNNSPVRQAVLLAVARSDQAAVSLATRLDRQVRLVAVSLVVSPSSSNNNNNSSLSSNRAAVSLEVVVRLAGVFLVVVAALEPLVSNHSSSKAPSLSSLVVCSPLDRTSPLRLVPHPALVAAVACLAVVVPSPVARLAAAAFLAVSLLSRTLVLAVRSLVAVLLVVVVAACSASLRLPAHKLHLAEVCSALVKAARWVGLLSSSSLSWASLSSLSRLLPSTLLPMVPLPSSLRCSLSPRLRLSHLLAARLRSSPSHPCLVREHPTHPSHSTSWPESDS